MTGKHIEVFLVEGIPGGITTAEIAGWTGHVLAGPRADLGDILKRPEAKRNGAYLLLGDDEEALGGVRCYIGRTEDFINRFRDHSAKKEFWDRAAGSSRRRRSQTWRPSWTSCRSSCRSSASTPSGSARRARMGHRGPGLAGVHPHQQEAQRRGAGAADRRRVHAARRVPGRWLSGRAPVRRRARSAPTHRIRAQHRKLMSGRLDPGARRYRDPHPGHPLRLAFDGCSGRPRPVEQRPPRVEVRRRDLLRATGRTAGWSEAGPPFSLRTENGRKVKME